MSNVKVMDHPLIQHKLGIMRRETTSTKEFRDLVSEVAMLICYEATRDLSLAEIEIKTPLTTTTAYEIQGKKLCIVPILRAGLHMADGMLNLIPNAKVGHIGLYRNEETLEPVEYFCKLPSDASEREIFVVDPMLATGGSASAAITLLKERGITKIRFLCLIAASEGVRRLSETHPDVDIFIGGLDEVLNEKGYIVPGLGDAGDRIYGTK
jgi:uracil phosphoribosyltransferase